MITLLITLAVFLLLSSSLGLLNPSSYFEEKKDKWGDIVKMPKQSQLLKLAVVVVICLVVAAINPIEVQRIDAGSVGLKIDRVGNEKGIPVARPCKGWVWYNTWLTDVVEYSIRQEHISYSGFTVTTKGGTPIDVSPSFNYALKSDRATDVYINLLKGGDFSSLKDTWISTATAIALKNASNRFTIDSIFNHQDLYQQAVEAEMNRELSKYFTVSQINPGQKTPGSMKGILESKAAAIQQAQQAELDRQTADAQAYTKIAKARGDSAEAVITAAGEAKAIQLKTRELSDNYVNYIKWLNANPDVPRVPQTVLGGNASVLLNK